MTPELKERFEEIADKFYNSNSQYDLMKCLEAAYALDRNEWIPVEKELPSPVEFVMCYSIKCGLSYRCFSRTHMELSNTDFKNITGVTHWYLPKAPQS